MKYSIGFLTLCYKEMHRFLRIWPQTILPPLITSALYFIIFGNLIGSQLRPIHGFSYMQFIAPGLILMPVLINSYTNTVSSFFIAKFHRNIEEILIAPIPNTLIILGFMCGGILRGILVGIAVTLVTLFFTHLQIVNLWLTFLIVILASAVFSLAGLANALFAKRFDDIAIIPTFIITPLTYLGGVFYSVQQLPPLWQKIAIFNPVLYMINAFRDGVLGISDINSYFALGIIFMVALGLFYLNLFFLKKGIGVKS